MLSVFWFVAFAIAWGLTVPTALAQLGAIGQSPVPAGLGNLIGVAPAIAAVIASLASGRRGLLSRTFRFRAPAISYGLAIGLPIAWLAITVLVRQTLGAAPAEVSFDPSVAAFAAIWLVLAFGEEIGWRGFALPLMTERSGFWRAATVLGIVWAVWHYPKLLSSPYVESLEQAAPLIAIFTLQIVLANFVLCWLFFRANQSVIVATLFHATFNVVATAYPNAAIDLYLTAIVAVCVLLIFIFDRRVPITEAQLSKND